jgi:hypothetical protein
MNVVFQGFPLFRKTLQFLNLALFGSFLSGIGSQQEIEWG